MRELTLPLGLSLIKTLGSALDEIGNRLKLKSLHRFTSTATAVEEITALQEGKLGKGLKQFLSDEIVEKGKGKESLLVSDKNLGELS